MKNHLLMLSAAAIFTAVTLPCAAEQVDSTRSEVLQEAVVMGVRASKTAPFAVANIKKEELTTFAKQGRELPFLFARTPGVTAWSENGVGTGTSYLRIRGAGDSRINVTLDGVPMNSPEDQCVFWANMNSYAAMLGSVQIQRGVGTSTNGDGAFGGAVSMHMLSPSEQPSARITASGGSYSTFNIGANFSTGLIGKHLMIDGAYHETDTKGYMHGTQGRSGSYYGALTWKSDSWSLTYRNIGNFEKTGQAWNGATAGNDDASLMDDGVRTYKDMWQRGLGRYNSLYERIVFNEDAWSFPRDTKGKYQTERYKMSDGSLWPRATDNFWQNKSILSAVWQMGERWQGHAALHYTRGYGYYTELKADCKLKKFGLSNFTTSDGSTIKKTDFVRKKGMGQNAYGLVANAQYRDALWDVVLGANVQLFDADHFGRIPYISNPEMSAHYLSDGPMEYYRSDAQKDDYSIYAKAQRRLGEHWSAFADLQYRHVYYRIGGVNDKFVAHDDGSYTNQQLDVLKHYNFFNPKAGVNYIVGQHRAYVSVAWSHREPERNNFTDNGSYPAPKPESLLDYELGYQYNGRRWHAGVNLYYMDYTNQFVQTGAVSDIGEALTTNIKSSYRMGAELTAGAEICPWLSIEANAALSRNRIQDFDEVVEDWDLGSQTIHYDDAPIAFSPSAVLNGFIDVHHRAFAATWHTGYVSRQYLDNTGSRDRSLEGYTQTDINLSLTQNLRSQRGLKSIVWAVSLGNIFNSHYAASGWVYSAISESSGYTNEHRYYQIGFVPMAGFTAMGHITLDF